MNLSLVRPQVGIMIDTESLGLNPKSVVTQVAFLAFALDDPETILREAEEYLPIQPQMDLGRRIEFDTILWMLGQPEMVRAKLTENRSHDFDEFTALVRSIVAKINSVTENGAIPYEIWVRRPQHDIPMLTSLFADCGLEVPWRYDTINDVATLMNLAGITKEDVDSTGLTPHIALQDCRLQLRGWIEGMRRLRSNA